VKVKPSVRYAAILVALCLLSVGISGCATIQSGGYEFQSAPVPTALNNTLKNGPVVVYFWTTPCPHCEQTTPKIENLKAQFNGTNVTFIRINTMQHNDTEDSIMRSYSVHDPPTTVVVRQDGAYAKWIGDFDINTVKSAIKDAQG
jgi:thiol-disulfide isomerase/thioredoxin